MEENNKKIDNKKKKKKIIYGDYDTKRETPLYEKHQNYMEGLTDEEVSVRLENLQVNREGKMESNFSKTLKMILKVVSKNTFTFFNVLYIIVLLLLLVAKNWNNKDLTNLEFAFTDFTFLIIL